MNDIVARPIEGMRTSSPRKHVLCESCWRARNPGRVAHRVEFWLQCRVLCCECRQPIKPEITVKGDPEFFVCHGDHPPVFPWV